MLSCKVLANAIRQEKLVTTIGKEKTNLLLLAGGITPSGWWWLNGETGLFSSESSNTTRASFRAGMAMSILDSCGQADGHLVGMSSSAFILPISLSQSCD